MEESERRYIKQNLLQLISNTTCTESFLAYLSQNNVLCDDDIQLIKTQRSGKAEAVKLYELIVTRTDGFKILKDALVSTLQSGASNILISYNKTFVHHAQAIKVERNTAFTFDLRAPFLLFTGRQKELQTLDSMVSVEMSKKSFTVICITGLGGIGKTELAKKYAHMCISNFDNVIWIQAESEANIAESFRRLAKDFLGTTTRDANNDDKDITTIVGDVYKLIQQTLTLLIFDNAENEQYLYKFLPVNYMLGENVVCPVVIFTSRETLWNYDASYSVKTITLDQFEETDAIEFVSKLLDICEPNEITEATLLVQTLQYYPLALQQAVSYIKETNRTDYYSISNYLMDYENVLKQIELLSFNTNRFEYSSTTLTTWKLTLSKIEQDQVFGSLAMKIINCTAFMSDSFERSLFHPFSSDNYEFKDISQAVKLLVKYSMITCTGLKLTRFRIHKLVQNVIRIDLQQKGKDEECISILLEMFMRPEHVAANHENVNHALEIWRHTKSHKALVAKYIEFPSKLVSTILRRVKNADAIELRKINFHLLEEHEKYNENLIELTFQLALSLHNCAKYREAAKRFEQYLDQVKYLCGESSEKFLDTMQYIANFKLQVGFYEEACLMFEDVFQRKVEAIGLYKVKTVDSLHNAAICYLEMSKYKKALEYYDRSLQLYEQVSDKDHVDAVLTTKQNIAVLKGDMGLYSQAIADLKLLKEMEQNKECTSFWGKSSDTLNLNLAYYLMLSGKYTEAYDICLDAERNLIRVHGADHPYTLTCQSNLAVIERKMGNIEKSLALQNKVYQKQKNILGADNDKTMVIKSEIALCWDHDLLEETTLVINKILRELEQRNGKENHFVLRLKLDYAGVLEKHEKYAESKQILEDAKRAIESKFGAEHESLPEISRKILAIGQVLENSKNQSLSDTKELAAKEQKIE